MHLHMAALHTKNKVIVVNIMEVIHGEGDRRTDRVKPTP